MAEESFERNVKLPADGCNNTMGLSEVTERNDEEMSTHFDSAPPLPPPQSDLSIGEDIEGVPLLESKFNDF